MKLKILGKGELRQNLEKLIKNKGLSKNVELVGHVENIYNYLKNSFCFILTSKWEDPGFVIIESAAARRIVFSSDCESGPKEFIGKNEKCGYLFNEGDEQSFIEKFDEMYEDIFNRPDIIMKKKLNALKKARLYSRYSHYRVLSNFLDNLES